MDYSISNVTYVGLTLIGDHRTAEIVLRYPAHPLVCSKMRVWNAHYGVQPIDCTTLLNILRHSGVMLQVHHLFWALLFLKSYETENVLATRFGVTCKTARKYIWQTVSQIRALAPALIRWDNRLINHDGRRVQTVSVDTKDCPTQEPFPFHRRNFSFKFHGPGLRYELGIATQSSNIVWINGPFLPGENNDLTIFRSGLKHMIPDGEKAVADGIYRGEPAKIQAKGDGTGNRIQRIWNARARARHETVNKELKKFRCLSQKLDVFYAIAVLIQVHIQYEPLFDIMLYEYE